MTNIEKLKEIINNNEKIVIFSGAGLSTNSGIPDFRSADGIYSQKYNSTLRPEEIISHSFFVANPDIFYKFYFEKMVYPLAKPNKAHLYFSNLEKNHKVTIVTQNIDNLHTLAGSSTVYELHGSVEKNYCTKCHKFYSLKDLDMKKVPYCTCGGIIKPDVVLYEEPLNDEIVNKAIKAISECDVLIIVGTSLTVYPAAYYVRYYRGKHLILLNKSETQYDNIAEISIHDDIVKVVEELEK